MKKEEAENKTKISSYILDIIFGIIIIPIILISMIVIYKSIVYPDKVPDIFGYKPFIILDENMEKSIDYGDLAITKIVDTDTLKTGDIIAYRNGDNFVILHKIDEVQETTEGRTFLMQIPKTEVGDTKYVKNEKVEGLLVNKVQGLGTVFMYLQDPRVLFLNIIIILIIGLIAYYVAEKLDEREKTKEFRKFII